MTLNDLVVFHDRETNLEDATRELAKIIGVKLPKAKEHHAKALGQNSYNGLLAHLSEYGEISINLSKYVDELSSVYGSTHKRELSTESIRQIAYSSFIVTLRAIYDRVTFSDFIRYALIESEQSVPLIAWGEIEASLTEKYDSLTYKEGIDNATYELHKFLLLNEVSDDLKKYISVSLREIRDVMSSVSRGEYRNSRFSLVELLWSYKRDIATYLTPKVYKVYLLPLVRLDKSPRLFYEMDDRELEPSELMVKAAEMNLMVSELHWGARFETLDRFMQPVNVKFGFPPYEGGFTFSEGIVSSPEGRLLPAYKEPSGRYTLSESMVSEHAVYIGFGERFDANNPETFDHLVCQFYPDYTEGRVNFGAGGLCRRSEIYVQVLVKKGEVLPKYALTELSSHLWELMGLKENENYILGKFTPIEFNGGVSIPSVIGKVISPVLKENPDHYAALDWYQGYSTERPDYSHKPVLDCSVKGVDVHIYGLTSAYTVRHFSDVNTMVEWSDDFEDGLEHISDMIVSRLLVSWFALDERFEVLIDLPEKLPDGAIRVNEIADRLNQLDIQELVAFYKQANKD